MDFKTMGHGRENIKYEKAIQQFGHNKPPTSPKPISPLGKSYFLDLTISVSALNFYKEKWVQTKSQTIK